MTASNKIVSTLINDEPYPVDFMNPPALTSERLNEELYSQLAETRVIYLMHIATYDFAIEYVRDKVVLDFGCGTGYGTARMAGHCESICGVDISAEAIEYASRKFAAPNLAFTKIAKVEQAPMPFSDGQFDVVLSFQVIEHVTDTVAYLSEVLRVLRPGGIFIVATPDRATRLLPKQRPWNRYHLVEYSGAELRCLLTPRFADVKLLTMSGTNGVIDGELRRTRRLKWLTLPFTFPFVPEWLRVRGLAALMYFKSLLSGKAGSVAASPDRAFDVQDIMIAEGLTPSVNLVALATKSSGD